jgi:site-specific DNA-methyltransferase (adenine-specific)
MQVEIIPLIFTEIEKLQRNVIYIGHVLDVLRKIPAESIDAILFSPPYYSKRDYTQKDGERVVSAIIWDGDPDCVHDWIHVEPARKATPGDLPGPNAIFKGKPIERLRPGKASDTCSKCGAWRGDLGAEPTFGLYIKHIATICDECYRILKPWGCMMINQGDSYAGSGGAGGDWDIGSKAKEAKWKQQKQDYPDQCLFFVPARTAIELVDHHGWCCHNDIIWHKPDPSRESITTRFTNDHEYIWFFSKHVPKKPFFYVNKINHHAQREKPPGIKGVENIDWKWSEHQSCKGNGCSKCEDGYIKHTTWMAFKFYFNQMLIPKKHPDVKGSRRFGGNKAKGYGNPRYSGNEYNSTAHDGNKNMTSTWSMATSKFTGGHFACWPVDLAKLILDAICPREICTKCELPRVRIDGKHWSDCGCNAQYKKGIGLDPFAGAGSSHIAGSQIGVDMIGIEINSEYTAIARKRINNDEPEKGQAVLF